MADRSVGNHGLQSRGGQSILGPRHRSGIAHRLGWFPQSDPFTGNASTERTNCHSLCVVIAYHIASPFKRDGLELDGQFLFVHPISCGLEEAFAQIVIDEHRASRHENRVEKVSSRTRDELAKSSNGTTGFIVKT